MPCSYTFTLPSQHTDATTMSTNTIKTRFKDLHSFEKRQGEAQRIRAKYPDRIPVIAERSEGSTLPTIDKAKYLCPGDLTVGQFVFVIRKRINLDADQAIFIFVNDKVLPPTHSLMSEVYKNSKDEDGFLYVTYAGESTFG